MKKKFKQIKLFFLKNKLNYFLNKFKKVSLRQKKYQAFLAKFKDTKSYFYLQTSKKYLLLFLFFSTFSSSIFYFYWKNKHSISIAIWTDYLTDEVIDKFKEKTGWNVNVVTFSSNGELLNKLNSTKFDVIMPSDFTIPELYKYGLIQPFDIKKIKKDQDTFSQKHHIDDYFYNKIIYDDHHPTMFQNLNFFDKFGNEKTFVQKPGNTESFYYPFYPGTIQFAYNKEIFNNLDKILNKYKITKNNFSFWKVLKLAMEDKTIQKPILFSDDPRNSFGFSKTLRLIDCAEEKDYSPECKEFFPYYTKDQKESADKNDFLNFQNPLDVIKSFELLEKIALGKNVKFLGDEIATNISDMEFSLGFIYNGAVSYALEHKNNQIEAVNFDKFSKNEINANVPFYTDGFVLGNNLSKEKKEISEKFISFATSDFSGYSTLKNYSFPTLNFDSVNQYIEEKFQEKNTNFLSNLLMLSYGDLDTSSVNKIISSFKDKFEKNLLPHFRLYTYNFDDFVNKYYNLFLTEKGAQS